MSVVLGVDIGGSHITAALVDLESRSIVEGSSKRKLVDSKACAEEIINDWCSVITEAFNGRLDQSGKIGIAMPGPFNYKEGIALIKDQDKFKALYKMNLKSILAERLAVQPGNIHFMNDAACFLQGEAFCGAARGYRRVFGLTLGTGLGSAICNEGIADDADLWNSNFKNGIAEDYLSTRWFVNSYQQISAKSISGVKELIEEVSEPIVEKIFHEFSENLAAFLLPHVKENESEIVVFGGNISNAHQYFLPSLQKKLHLQNVDIIVKKAQLNEDASLLGAASCWQVFEKTKGTTHASVTN